MPSRLRTKPFRAIVSAFVLLLVCYANMNRAQAETHGARQVLLLSDVHLSPMSVFKDCADAPTHARFLSLVTKPAGQWTSDDLNYQKGLGSYGRDSSFALLQSALAAAHTAEPHPALIIVSGDFVAHHLDHAFQVCYANLGRKTDDAAYADAYREFTAKIVTFVMLEITRTWLGVQVVAALGNNDSDRGDYLLPSGDFLRSIGPVFSAAAGVKGNLAQDFSAPFDAGGYYAVTLRNFDHAEALVLNSNLWTGRASVDDKSSAGAAAAELAWLKQQIETAKAHKRNLLVVGHVPPGLDPFASKLAHSVETMYAACNPGSHGCTDYSEIVPRLLSANAATVKLAIFGHTHSNDFRVDGGVPLLIAPSISPIVQNNPAFVLLTTDAQLRPQDAVSWNIQLSAKEPQWQREFDFRQAYDMPDMSGASLLKLSQKLADDAALRKKYFYYFVSESDAAVIADKWQEPYLCAVRHLTTEGVTPCLLGAMGLPF